MNAVGSADELVRFRMPTLPWVTVGQVGAALAASMGIGRFVYTPVLPMMEAQAGLTPSAGAALATANYLGYLVGALAGIVLPALVRSAAAMRVSLLILTATLALMPVTSNETAWAVMRCVAGATSAMVFVIAVSAMHAHLGGHAAQLSGWAFGGIGAGIAQTAGSNAGSGAWLLVGLAALPSGPLWASLGRRWSRPTLLVIALIVQAVGIALPAVAGGIWPALISAFLFGGTFLGISQMSLTIGAHLQFPRAVAILTTGYSLGQIAGPLIVTPLLSDGYHLALLVASGIVLAAALAAAAPNVRSRRRVTVD
ncbi:YbfB/YjiJ family MFS transporter [Rhodococcus sp. WS4]|nr:YbfB/YjiJ family MFS transporter [Rhodococcus sp. WS4]